MKLPHVAALSLLLAGCGSSSSDASGKGPGSSPGMGGSGGDFGGLIGPDDFGYAADGERGDTASDAPGAMNGPSALTLCGEYNLAQTTVLRAHPAATHSLASATRAREKIDGKLPPVSSSVRLEDHLSYFRPGAAPALAPGMLTALAALRPLEIGGTPIPGRYQLYVSVQAGPVKTRPKVSLTTLVDTSPSMAGEPLARARKALRALADGLAPGDHLTVMTTDSDVLFDQALVDPSLDTQGLEEKLVLGAETTPGFPLESALEKAASLPGMPDWNRVVFISDGQGDPATLPLAKLEQAGKSGVRTSSVGVGGSFVVGDALLYRAAQAGRGRYAYLDHADEADRMLRARFNEVFGVAMDDVSVEVTLPWFLKSAETPGSAGTPAPQSLTPGGVLSFVFTLQACHTDVMMKYGGSYELKVAAKFVDPELGIPGQLESIMKTSDYLKASSTGLDQLLATQAYVAAIKAPSQARFADALAELEPLKQPGNAFEEMWSLLTAYPKKP